MDVAVLLERGQVIQQRGLLECFLAFHPGDRRRGTGSDFLVCRFCRSLVLELFRVEEHAVRVLPFQGEVQLPVRGGYETPVLLEAGADHGECRGLHAPDGVVRRAGGYRQRAAGVHAHQPVRLCPAVGGGIQAVVIPAVPEVRHALADGLGGERGDPQALERFGVAQVGIDPAEDKLPLAGAVGRHDDAVALRQYAVNDFQLSGGGKVRHHALVRPDLAGYQPERVRQHRKVFGTGLRVAVRARHGERHEVSQRPCDHVAVAGTVAVLLVGSPDHTGYIHADTRFFCYDCFHVLIKFKPFPAAGTGKRGTAV